MAALDWKKVVKPVSSVPEFNLAKLAKEDKSGPKFMVAKGIDKQIKALEAKDYAGRPWFRIQGEMAAFRVLHRKKPLALVGKDTELAVELSKLPDVFRAIKDEVLAGGFDKQLNSIDAGAALKRMAKHAG